MSRIHTLSMQEATEFLGQGQRMTEGNARRLCRHMELDPDETVIDFDLNSQVFFFSKRVSLAQKLAAEE